MSENFLILNACYCIVDNIKDMGYFQKKFTKPVNKSITRTKDTLGKAPCFGKGTTLRSPIPGQRARSSMDASMI